MHPDCPGAPKVDPRVRRTRKLLEDALRALLDERPYGEISVGDIADRATVNRATFYAHYEDKHHLATTMLRDDLEAALHARLRDCAPINPESLYEAAVAIFEFIGGIRQACPTTGKEFGEMVLPTLQEAVEAFLLTWLKIHPEAMSHFKGSTPEAVAMVLSWGLYGGAVAWAHLARRPPVDAAAREVVRLLIH